MHPYVKNIQFFVEFVFFNKLAFKMLFKYTPNQIIRQRINYPGFLRNYCLNCHLNTPYKILFRLYIEDDTYICHTFRKLYFKNKRTKLHFYKSLDKMS